MVHSPITFSSQTNKTEAQKQYKIYYVLFSYQLAGQITLSLQKKMCMSIKFSWADSHVQMGRFSDISGTNSVPIFRVCWWFGSIKTGD